MEALCLWENRKQKKSPALTWCRRHSIRHTIISLFSHFRWWLSSIVTYNVSSPPSKSWKSLVKEKKKQTLRRKKEYHSVWIRKTSLVKATGTGGQISRVKQYLSYIKLKKRFTVIYAITSLDTKTDLQSPRIVILKADRRFVVLLLSTFSGFSILPRVFPLPLATLLVIVSSSSLHWANKKKGVCHGLLFPRILIHRHWRH